MASGSSGLRDPALDAKGAKVIPLSVVDPVLVRIVDDKNGPHIRDHIQMLMLWRLVHLGMTLFPYYIIFLQH